MNTLVLKKVNYRARHIPINNIKFTIDYICLQVNKKNIPKLLKTISNLFRLETTTYISIRIETHIIKIGQIFF